MRLLGAILAGGQSRRFGSDKAAALLDGRPLIAHVAEALRRDCDAILVCGRFHPDLMSLEDSPRPGLGPLGGLSAALKHGAADGFDAVFSAPCDAPDLPRDLIQRLLEAGPAAYLANLPVIGLWPCALAEALDHHLATSEDRSLRAWARAAAAVPVTLSHSPTNINTPEDLVRLRIRSGS